MSMKSECKFDLYGWITLRWLESGNLKWKKFDTVSEAKSLYRELKKKGLK